VAERKDRLFKIGPGQYQNTKVWSTGPTALLYYSRLDTISLQHKNIRHKKSTLTFISTIYLSQALLQPDKKTNTIASITVAM